MYPRRPINQQSPWPSVWLCGVLLLIAAAVFVYYSGLAPGHSTAYYRMLAEAFLAGRTSLDILPRPDLLALANPYDPIANRALRLQDATLFNGRYYLYFGPVPALFPWLMVKWLTGIALTDRALTLFFLIAGTACLLALAFSLAARIGERSPAALAWIGVSLSLATWLPFLARRPFVYEAAISGAYFFTALGALLLWDTLRRADRHAWPGYAAASLCFGLAAGCRLPYALTVLLLFFAWMAASHGEGRGQRLRHGAALFLPWLGAMAALAAYNYARFGDIFETGARYQLTIYDVRSGMAFLSPGQWAEHVYVYLMRVLPWNFGQDFPFLGKLGWRRLVETPFGESFVQEPAFGLWVNSPFSLFMLALLAPAVWRGMDARARWLLAGIAAYALAMLGFVSLYFFITQRYAVDFAPWFMLLAGIGYLRRLSLCESARERRLLLTAGGALAAIGVISGLSAGYCGYVGRGCG